MVHDRKVVETYAFMVDHVKKKLSGWKAKSLSMAGRITLAQSSLFSIPDYVMQTTVIPVAICEEIERLCRDFIWGSTADKRRCHVISWEKICRLKEEGGFGFHGLRMLNQSYMIKLRWRLIHNADCLWARVLKSKYGCGVQSLPNVGIPSRVSHTWRGTAKEWHHVQNGVRWVVNNGHRVRFWKDHWLKGVPRLEDHVVGVIPPHETMFLVNCFVLGNDWNWDRFQYLLPPDIISKIASMKPLSEGLEDAPRWGLANDGQFSLKSAYLSLYGAGLDCGDGEELFKDVWRWKGPQRIRTFLWKVAHGKLLTNLERMAPGDDPVCYLPCVPPCG